MEVLTVIMVITIFVMAGILIVERTRRLERENAVLQIYMEDMQSYYQSILWRIEEFRKYRHDLAKHIGTLERLLDGRTPSSDIRDYMKDMQEQYLTAKTEIYCEDEIVNAVCEMKVQQCREHEIPFQIQADYAGCRAIKDVDMVGLLYNLLENAMEANERISSKDEKGITFAMRDEGERICIEVKNRILKGTSVDFSSRKEHREEHREEHGIGMRIIRELTDKYHGSMECFTDNGNGEFTVRVVLNPEK